jgi:hypothetical protein
MQVPLATMMEEGQEGWGEQREESRLASGVVWKVAPESAIQSGLADRSPTAGGTEGGGLTVVLKAQPTRPGEAPEGVAHRDVG